jgi:hypothetical protein
MRVYIYQKKQTSHFYEYIKAPYGSYVTDNGLASDLWVIGQMHMSTYASNL